MKVINQLEELPCTASRHVPLLQTELEEKVQQEEEAPRQEEIEVVDSSSADESLASREQDPQVFFENRVKLLLKRVHGNAAVGSQKKTLQCVALHFDNVLSVHQKPTTEIEVMGVLLSDSVTGGEPGRTLFRPRGLS